jgi:alanine racemase
MRQLSFLEVYWNRLEDNWRVIQKLAPQAKILPMIKANAYGHGLKEIAQFLEKELQAEALGVATLFEALELKSSRPIYVFSENNLVSHPGLYSSSIYPVIHDLLSLKIFLADSHFSRHPLILKVDTGMNRLGIAPGDWEECLSMIVTSGRRSIDHLMSHFATSYYLQKPADMISRQQASFKKAQDFFSSKLKIHETSMANSGAIEQGLNCDETWVRPGLMLYGPGSFECKTKMISSLVTHVMKVSWHERGTPIGYGVHVTPEKGVIALLPLGYGDGFATQSSGFKIKIKQWTGFVFGRVNMDMSAVYFPAEAWGKIQVGDCVRIWDEEPQSLVDWATHMQTHAYQALCGISSRIPRHYRLG